MSAILRRQYRIYKRNENEFDAEMATWTEDESTPRCSFIGERYKSLSGAKSAVKRYSVSAQHEIGRFEWTQKDEDYWMAEGLI